MHNKWIRAAYSAVHQILHKKCDTFHDRTIQKWTCLHTVSKVHESSFQIWNICRYFNDNYSFRSIETTFVRFTFICHFATSAITPDRRWKSETDCLSWHYHGFKSICCNIQKWFAIFKIPNLSEPNRNSNPLIETIFHAEKRMQIFPNAAQYVRLKIDAVLFITMVYILIGIVSAFKIVSKYLKCI